VGTNKGKRRILKNMSIRGWISLRLGFLALSLSTLSLSATTIRAQEKPEPPPGPSAAFTAGLSDKDFHDFHEDYKSLKLDTSTLAIKESLIGQRGTTQNFDQQTVRVRWRPNDPIDLYIALPKGVEKPPVIIYLYGFPTDEKRYHDESWYGRITSSGFAAVAFFPAVTGPRFHAPRPMTQNFLTQLPESLPMTVHDIQMVINYLYTRKDLNLDLDRIGIFATGSGATAAILAAVADPRIKALDLLNPWGDWPDWMAKSELLSFVACEGCNSPEFLQGLAPLDPVKRLPQLNTPYVRFRHFVENGQTPRIAQDKMEAVIPKSADITRFENVMEFNRSASGGKTFDWVKGALKFEIDVQAPKTAAEKPPAKDSPH
jgi:hypothetical protein